MTQMTVSTEYPVLPFDILELIIDELAAESTHDNPNPNRSAHLRARSRMLRQALVHLSLTTRILRQKCQSYLFREIYIHEGSSMTKVTRLTEVLTGESGLHRHVRSVHAATHLSEYSLEDGFEYSRCAIGILDCLSNVQRAKITLCNRDEELDCGCAAGIGAVIPSFLGRNPLKELSIDAESFPVRILVLLPPSMKTLDIRGAQKCKDVDRQGLPLPSTSLSAVTIHEISDDAALSLQPHTSALRTFSNLTSCSLTPGWSKNQLQLLYALAVLPSAHTLEELQVTIRIGSYMEGPHMFQDCCIPAVDELPNLKKLALHFDIGLEEMSALCPQSMAALVHCFISSPPFQSIDTLELTAQWVLVEHGGIRRDAFPLVIDRQFCGWDEVDEYLSSIRTSPNLTTLLLDFVPVSLLGAWSGTASVTEKAVHRKAAQDVYDMFQETRKRVEIKFKVPKWYSASNAGMYGWDWRV